jgi:uroporphyrinogen decarboxylase
MHEVLKNWHQEVALQGNVDPEWLFLPSSELERRLREVFSKVLELPSECRKGWICGLGHGVLPKTPEDNVRLFLRLQKEMFA